MKRCAKQSRGDAKRGLPSEAMRSEATPIEAEAIPSKAMLSKAMPGNKCRESLGNAKQGQATDAGQGNTERRRLRNSLH